MEIMESLKELVWAPCGRHQWANNGSIFPSPWVYFKRVWLEKLSSNFSDPNVTSPKHKQELKIFFPFSLRFFSEKETDTVEIKRKEKVKLFFMFLRVFAYKYLLSALWISCYTCIWYRADFVLLWWWFSGIETFHPCKEKYLFICPQQLNRYSNLSI